jgi:hypothetical protein
MSEWQRYQEYNRIVIGTASPESCPEVAGCAAAVSAVWPAANTAIYIPFVVHQEMIAVKMGISNGATVSGNVDIGIYDDQQNRLVSKGSTAQSGVSAIQSFDITDTTLLPGIYFMALNMDNVTGTVIRWTMGVAGVSGGFGIYNQTVGAVTLPATAAFAAPTLNGFIPSLFVTARTVI